MNNKHKLDLYMEGFNDELNDEISQEKMKIKAYSLGSLHAIIGDDVRSVDNLSDEDILKLIKQ